VAETEEVVESEAGKGEEIENGTGTVDLPDAMLEEMMMIDRQEGIEIFLTTEEVVVEDGEVTEEIGMEALEEDLTETARRAQLLHPRRRNPPQTLRMLYQFLSARGV
jgi:hypothetical protein